MSDRARFGVWALAALLTGFGLVCAVSPIERGDSYCGTVLYDTTTAAPCSSPIEWRRILVSLCFAGAAALVLLLALSCDRARRRFRIAGFVLLAIAFVAALVMLNRLLQPTQSEWCGSVLNRHRTYESEIESRCDHLIAAYRNEALGAGIATICSLWFGVRLWRRRAPNRQDVC